MDLIQCFYRSFKIVHELDFTLDGTLDLVVVVLSRVNDRL